MHKKMMKFCFFGVKPEDRGSEVTNRHRWFQ